MQSRTPGLECAAESAQVQGRLLCTGNCNGRVDVSGEMVFGGTPMVVLEYRSFKLVK